MIDIGVSFRKLPLFEKIYQTILVLLIIISSGFPLFVNNKGVDIFVFLFAAAGAAYYRLNLYSVAKATAVFALLMLIQTAVFGEFYFPTSVYQIILFCSAALCVSILGLNLIYLYKKIILVIASWSIVLFIPILINFGFLDILLAKAPVVIVTEADYYEWVTSSTNILFMHFPPDFFMGLTRNSGPFWEPAAFGGYLMIAILFNVLIHNTIKRKENLVYIAALITTFSTTTYLAFLFFVIAYTFVKIKNPPVKWGALAFCILIGSLSLQKIDFLGKKIELEIKEAEYQAIMKGGDTRMASAYLDLKEITESPYYILFGRGSHPVTRVQGPDKEVLRTNGITDLLSRFGLIFFVFAIYGLFKTLQFIAKIGGGKAHLPYVALATLLILAFSEIHFIYLFFKVLILFKVLNNPQLFVSKQLRFRKNASLELSS